MQREESRLLGVPRTVVTLGIVSLLTDISSEMLVPVIPLFLQDVLRAPKTYIGLIEGIAESTASLLRVIAGWISDRTGRPKALAVGGYGVSAAAKPFFALAAIWQHVLLIRFLDRLGKGLRSAPRDVIIAEATDQSTRGRAFGLHRAMDTIGAVLGPLIVFLLLLPQFLSGRLSLPRETYQLIFFVAAVPAILGVLVLTIFVPERPRSAELKPLPKITLGAFDRKFKFFLLAIVVFGLGNSSDAFLVLRARDLGLGVAEVLLIFVFFNAVGAALAMPSGIASDTLGRKPVIVVGLLIFAAVYAGFAVAESRLAVWGLFMVYGLYYALTEGVMRAYAADLAPTQLRGTALGAYWTFNGLAILPASVIAGLLWDNVSRAAPFWYGAGAAIMGAFLLVTLVKDEAMEEFSLDS